MLSFSFDLGTEASAEAGEIGACLPCDCADVVLKRPCFVRAARMRSTPFGVLAPVDTAQAS
jgi:hypothetical protein